jgi:hypothetical protein
MPRKKKTSATAAAPAANLATLKIGSRVRCTDDGVTGRIVWANAVSVKIRWDDGEPVTWRRDSLAGRPIAIVDAEDQPDRSAAPPDPVDTEYSQPTTGARGEAEEDAHGCCSTRGGSALPTWGTGSSADRRRQRRRGGASLDLAEAPRRRGCRQEAQCPGCGGASPGGSRRRAELPGDDRCHGGEGILGLAGR